MADKAAAEREATSKVTIRIAWEKEEEDEDEDEDVGEDSSSAGARACTHTFLEFSIVPLPTG